MIYVGVNEIVIDSGWTENWPKYSVVKIKKKKKEITEKKRKEKK